MEYIVKVINFGETKENYFEESGTVVNEVTCNSREEAIETADNLWEADKDEHKTVQVWNSLVVEYEVNNNGSCDTREHNALKDLFGYEVR